MSTTPPNHEESGSLRLWDALRASQGYGFFGPGSLDTPFQHAHGFLDVAVTAAATRGHDAASALWLDLGSGGGLPGLVGIDRFPSSSWVLLDAQAKRVRFLQSIVDSWDVGDRVTCVLGRAEELYRAGSTSTVDVVVARGFGAPAVTAECATPLLGLGGLLIVSEPPESTGVRWDGVDRAGLGLAFHGVRKGRNFGFAVLEKVHHHEDHIPRASAVFSRKPLF